MACNEPLYDDETPTISVRDCQLELGHPGAHEYFGKKYPRPVPSGEAEEALDLIHRAAGRQAWELDEREYYVAFEVTNVYLIKVSGEDEDAALKVYSDYDEFPDFSREQAIDGGVEIRRADRYELSNMTGAPFGPRIACPDCGREEMRREWAHNPLRRCHGPIEWRETQASNLQWRYRREFNWGPVYSPALAGA
ncbi:hypothetical protein [Streptomyces sp. NBC_00306]|uniref:hypothetical protein n=1 Tax=Streptomyces sp. NBC_00306 TaxID=2975708 RepID=UPI002E2BA6E1|nr:hypothetical protein [Streptomyces sp. NBC_00306]